MNIDIIIPIAPNKTLEAEKSLKSQKDVNIIVEKGTNPPRNRNRGIAKSKSPLIAFINAHTILPKDWHKKVSAFFKKHPEIDIAGGPQLNYQKESFFGKASGHALSSIFGAAEASVRYKTRKTILDANEKYLTSANLICRKEVFDKIKFDESIYPGEDPKFVSDSKKAGFKVAYSPDIPVFHLRRKNTKDLSKQIFNYGITRPQKESLSQTLKKPLFIVPALFIIYLSIFPILAIIHPIFILPILLYILLSIFFSLYESSKNNNLSSFPILPFIFFTIHLMYGIGFIYGTLQKK